MPEDLWGDLKSVPVLRTPLTVLKEQAQLLSTKMDRVIEGRVSSEHGDEGTVHTLSIYAPTLSYTVQVLSLWHDIDLYPVDVIYLLDRDEDDETECANEEQLLEALRAKLSHASVRRVISSLLSQIAAA